MTTRRTNKPAPHDPGSSAAGTVPSGFPRAPGEPGAIVRPTPLPKRPKGRWFFGLLLVTLAGWGGYQVWNSFFRYQAYGNVSGRVLHISPPWDGVVRYLHVKEGQRVSQGDLLLTIDNNDMRQRYAQLGDELRITQAQLEAEAAKLKWQVTFNLDQGHGALAQYFETLGQLLREQSELEYLQGASERAQNLHSKGAVATEEYTRTTTLLKGQKHKVDQLQKAVNELKTRADQSRALVNAGTAEPGLSETGLDQLKPHLARIESIQAERSRLQERLNQGRILAPTNGLIVKIQLFAGENCKGNDPMLFFLEEGSLQVTLYMPQKAAESLACGSDVNVIVDPYREPLACTVTRLGDQFEAAPENLKRHYSEGEKLLPIILQPKEECARWVALRVGEVVKLPYHLWRTSSEEPR